MTMANDTNEVRISAQTDGGSFGSRVSDDFNILLSEAADIHVKRKFLGLQFYFQMLADFDQDTILSNFPRPGTGTKDNPQVGNFKTDIYTRSAKNANGERQGVRGSWCVDFIAGTKTGMGYHLEVLKAKDVIADKQGCDQNMKRWSREELDSYINTYSQRFDADVAKFREGLNVFWQVYDILQKIKNTDVAFMWRRGVELGDDGLPNDGRLADALETTTTPIVLVNKIKKRGDVMSVGQFLNLDVQRAVENGADYEALLATKRREVAEPDGDGINVESVEEWDSAVASMESFAGGKAINNTAILSFYMKDENAAELETFMELVAHMNALAKKLERKYTSNKEKQIDQLSGMAKAN